MTKAVSRKSGKKSRTEDVKKSTVRPAKKHLAQEPPRRWMIWLVLCFLIGAVVVFFISAFQFTSKEKVSEGKNFDQSKKVKERRADHDRASDGRKENNAGITSAVSLI